VFAFQPFKHFWAVFKDCFDVVVSIMESFMEQLAQHQTEWDYLPHFCCASLLIFFVPK
jgi:hypothetical protein